MSQDTKGYFVPIKEYQIKDFGDLEIKEWFNYNGKKCCKLEYSTIYIDKVINFNAITKDDSLLFFGNFNQVEVEQDKKVQYKQLKLGQLFRVDHDSNNYIKTLYGCVSLDKDYSTIGQYKFEDDQEVILIKYKGPYST